MRMNWGDIATWATAGVALLFGASAFGISLRSLRWERSSAEAAVRSAEAAERANRLTAMLLERDHLVVRPESPPKDISWQIERPSKYRFVLRNVGTAIADNVTIDPNSAPAVARALPSAATIQPGSSAEFVMIGAMGSPIPNELWVSWDGQPEPVAVPVPG